MIKEYGVKSLLVFVWILSSFACAAKDDSIPLLSIKGANWTSEEITYIKALHQKGSIHIATKISSSIYEQHKDGSVTGFHYILLKEFADLAKIAINIKLVAWNEYFYKKGEDLRRVESDPSYSYVPELIEYVDLYLDGFTALPWREKMFDIIKFIPTRQMVVSRKNNKPRDVADLDNKVCAMIKHTSMEKNIEQLKKRYHINVIYKHAANFDAMDKMVSDSKADYTVYDSDRAFSALANYDNLTIAWPISSLQMQGWGINKNNKLLKSILVKYIHYTQQNALLDKYWKRSYGVTFIEYLRILRLGDTKH